MAFGGSSVRPLPNLMSSLLATRISSSQTNHQSHQVICRLVVSLTLILQNKIMATCPQPPSFDKQLASLESHPLFMSSLPEDTADNPVLSALQSLVHDGTPVGRYVPLCVPRRWRSYTRGSM
jgi:hypothetical protein